MSSSYTSSLRLVLPVQGELDNTWGDTVNAGLTNLTDSAIAGTAAVPIADANTTLTSNNGAADQARGMFLSLTGSLTAGRSVICPSVSKLYFATNGTTGGFATTLKTAGGTGIAIPPGHIMALYCDGTNVKDAISYVSSLQSTSLYSSGGATVVGNVSAGTLTSSGAVTAVGNVSAATLTSSGGISGTSLALSGGAVVTGSLSAGTLSTAGNAFVSGGGNFGSIGVSGTATITGAASVGSGSTGVTPSTGDRSTKLATTAMFTNEFASSLATSGYQKLPSGLIVQWGYDGGGAGNHNISYPIAFPNNCFNVQATMDNGGSSDTQILSCSVGNVGQLAYFSIYPRFGNNGATFGIATQGIYWMAIGN